MEQIEQAVIYAFDPHAEASVKAEAHNYCEQVKNAPDAWQICLQLFMKEPKAVPQARFFALQVLDITLQNRFDSLDTAAIGYIRQSIMEFLHREFIKNIEESPDYIRNKVAQSLTYLFAQVYPTIWPSFFKDMIELTKLPKDPASRAKVADFILRLCINIDEEIARVDIPRNRGENDRNTAIKDAMRLGDTQLLASFWFDLLQEYRSSNPNISKHALDNFGSYIAWIDISLVVNDQVMSVLYELLGDRQLRNTACECFSNVISKGMLPMDKLGMIQNLHLTNTLQGLEMTDEDFVEHVARLINVLGTELCKIYADNAVQGDGKVAAWGLIEHVLPYLLKFLADKADDTTTAVFPFVNDILTILKKQKKALQPFTNTQEKMVGDLLKVIFMRMKYEDTAEWGGEEDEPEDDVFQELRKNLKIFSEHISTINENLYIGYVHSVVMETLENYKNSVKLGWSDVELCLFVLFNFGEALPKAAMVFVNPKDPSTLTPLGELVAELVMSNITSFGHPAVSLRCFENVARYYQFFGQRPEYLPQILQSFVSEFGLHFPLKHVRIRCWYFFYRFVKNLKSQMGPYVESILSSVNDLLTIVAEMPEETSSMDGVSLPTASTFGSQLYLFETVGMVISLQVIPVEKQTEYLKVVLDPLVAGIQKSLSQGYNQEDELNVIRVHHYIMAIGSIAKGFPDIPKGSTCTYPWVMDFKQVTELSLNALQMFSRFVIIRDAARSAFSRLINCLGLEIVPYLPTLINGLLSECQATELVDFLPFVGLVAHKFKPHAIIDELLLPLVKRIFDFLNITPSGTDEAIMLIDMRKSYLNLIINLFNAELQDVFVSEHNAMYLNMILQSILHFAKNNDDPGTQKLSFAAFMRMAQAWSGQDQAGGTNAFVQFAYNDLIPATFAVPMGGSFNVTDGQSLLVFGEISSIQKTIFKGQGEKYLEYMKTVFMPSIQCPSDIAEQYCQAIQQCDDKAFKKYFQSFIQQAKS